MPSQLTAEVSIATAEAYRNLNQMSGMVEQAQSSLKSLGTVVVEQEQKIEKLSEAAKEAEKQFKETGAEADKLKMEDLREAVKDATTKAVTMKGEYSRVSQGLVELSNETTKVAKTVRSANQEMASDVREVGKAQKEASNEGEAGNKKVDAATKDTISSTKLLGAAFSGLGISSAIFGLIKKAVEELDERIKKTQETLKGFGEAKLDYNRQIQDVIHNLGLTPDKAGQARAGAMVTALQQVSPGLTPEVAATILAKGQATGFAVADVNKPGMDTKSVGFNIAGEVAKFSRRMHLDPDTAGKLFNMAKISGVHSVADMEKMLAQLEGGFHDIAITDPKEGMQTAIRASAGRMTQGVALPQAIAAVAAAAIGEPEATVAATNVEQFSRIAMGTDDRKKLTLATLAQKHGLISESTLENARRAIAPTMKKDNVDEIRHAQEKIASLQESMKKREQDTNDFLADNAERTRRVTETVTDIDKDLADPRKRKQYDDLREKRANAVYDLGKLDRSRQEKVAEKGKGDADTQLKIRETRISIAQKTATDKRELEAAALREAYTGVPLAAKERLLYEATEGMNEQELSVFVGQSASGRMSRGLVRMLSPSGREAYIAAQKSASVGDVDLFRKQNKSFTLSDISEADAAKQAAEASRRAGMPTGQDFLNNVGTLVEADIQNLKGKGEGRDDLSGRSGIATGSLNLYNNASDPRLLTAKRKMVVTRNLFARWHASLGPASAPIRKKWDAEINANWQIFWQRWKFVFTPGWVNNAVEMADLAVKDVGALIQKVQADAQKMGVDPGNAAPDIKSPSLESLDVSNDPQMKGGGGANPENRMPDATPAIEGGTLTTDATDRGGMILNPATGGGRGIAGGSAGGVASAGFTQYNVSVGMVVSQGSEEMDLPGRLGLPDIG